MIDINWTKTGIYYLVIGHACDEEQEWQFIYSEKELTDEVLEQKFTNFVLKELGLLFEKEVYIDFIFKSNSPIEINYG